MWNTDVNKNWLDCIIIIIIIIWIEQVMTKELNPASNKCISGSFSLSLLR